MSVGNGDGGGRDQARTGSGCLVHASRVSASADARDGSSEGFVGGGAKDGPWSAMETSSMSRRIEAPARRLRFVLRSGSRCSCPRPSACAQPREVRATWGETCALFCALVRENFIGERTKKTLIVRANAHGSGTWECLVKYMEIYISPRLVPFVS